MSNEDKNRRTKKSDLLFYISLIVMLLVFLSSFQLVRVEGSSMENTLLNGDLLLMKRNWLVGEYNQGDIIVAAKDSYHNGEYIVKRIIAVSGQVVDIDNRSGTVYVDGVALDESYALTPTYEQGEIVFPLTVKENCYFVLGDNREDSVDSRYYNIGQIHANEIKGEIMRLLLPRIESGNFDISRIGIID